MSNFTFSAREDDIHVAAQRTQQLNLPVWTEFVQNVDVPVWSKPMHMHQFIEIAYVTAGRGTYHIVSENLPIRAGDIIYVQNGFLHDTTSCNDAPLKFWVVHVLTPSFFDERLPNSMNVNTFPVLASGEHGAFIENTFLEMQRIYAENGPSTYLLCQMMLAPMLALLRKLYAAAPGRRTLEDQSMQLAHRVAMYIIEHYREDLTLTSLADAFFVCPSHLSREFTKAFNISPINYVIDLRFQEARTLLLHTDTPIKEIASTVGYSNVHHFNNMFLKRIGFLPLEFRERFQ